MPYRKCLLLFCLILIFTTAGCGKKPDKAELPKPYVATEKAETVSITPVGEKMDAGGPVVMAQKKMIEPEVRTMLEEGEILVSDFEDWPNNLGGEMGVYGALEPNWDDIITVPYSWVYEPIALGYDIANVHTGNQSFRLVNALGLKPELAWGSFAMDLGPTIDLTVVPKKVESLDVSGYKYLVFWVKGEKGGEKMELLIRDAHALNYMPQVKYNLPDATTEWHKVVIPLDELAGRVDLSQLDNIGIAFGKDIGNMKGEIVYIDDFVFTNTP